MMSRKEIRHNGGSDWQLYDAKTPVIINTAVNYAEKQKAVFLVTPPHLIFINNLNINLEELFKIKSSIMKSQSIL